MTHLSVNLNKVALLRNQRDIGYPDVVATARGVLAAGADGITVHPRPDERHIRPDDVRALSTLLQEYGPDCELNVEGYPSPAFLDLIKQTRPQQVTLVPDPPETRTSDTGWDFARYGAFLAPIVAKLQSLGCRVSLFVEPDPMIAARAAATQTDRVELYTGPYAFAHQERKNNLLPRYRQAAQAFRTAGLGLNAGHDLNLENLAAFCAAVPDLAEVSIGHALTADALMMGWTAAVGAYKDALSH